MRIAFVFECLEEIAFRYSFRVQEGRFSYVLLESIHFGREFPRITPERKTK